MKNAFYFTSRALSILKIFSLQEAIQAHLFLTFSFQSFIYICWHCFLRRAYMMKLFFHDLEIFISIEKCQNISGSEMHVLKYYSVWLHNQVLFIRS